MILKHELKSCPESGLKIRKASLIGLEHVSLNYTRDPSIDPELRIARYPKYNIIEPASPDVTPYVLMVLNAGGSSSTIIITDGDMYSTVLLANAGPKVSASIRLLNNQAMSQIKGVAMGLVIKNPDINMVRNVIARIDKIKPIENIFYTS
jgi:hypothetical protein